MAGWITSPWHGIHNAFVALFGVSCILLTRVITWEDLLADGKAWDALVWFGALLMMADELNRSGAILYLSKSAFALTKGLAWPVVALLLAVTYLYIHYGFASMTAHVTALYPGFLATGVAAGCPPLLLSLVLAFFSNLNAGMTHYGTGSAPVYFGSGYVSQTEWWRIGFLISVMNVLIWLGIGSIWWKIIGLW
jgi:DASS family divalent anion:Na+ symporter